MTHTNLEAASQPLSNSGTTNKATEITGMPCHQLQAAGTDGAALPPAEEFIGSGLNVASPGPTKSYLTR